MDLPFIGGEEDRFGAQPLLQKMLHCNSNRLLFVNEANEYLCHVVLGA